MNVIQMNLGATRIFLQSKKLLALSSLLFATLLTTSISAQWSLQQLDTKASFRGLSVVNNKVIWLSGTNGTVLRTLNGGQTWQTNTVKGAEKLDFRDVEAFNENLAYILSIGPGANSRIYKTENGGQTWQLQFQNEDKDAFFDALAFWDKNNGLAMSDPVRGHFLVLRTKDGGKHWSPIAPESLPKAKDGEGGFAGSGTCLITKGKNAAYLVSGGAVSRVYQTLDRGQTWSVVAAPIISGSAGAGIFSIAFATQSKGIIVGGDYQKPTLNLQISAITSDGGKTWVLGNSQPQGFRSGVAISATNSLAIAVGTTGTDISLDVGLSWSKLDNENFNVVAFAPNGTVWAAGPNGRLGRRIK